jgi:hypothetical protein
MAQYTAREINNGKQVEIDLPAPFGKVKLTGVRRHADQSPVTSAEVDIDGGLFQVMHLGYQDGTYSNYLGNCYTKKTDDGVWF